MADIPFGAAGVTVTDLTVRLLGEDTAYRLAIKQAEEYTKQFQAQMTAMGKEMQKSLINTGAVLTRNVTLPLAAAAAAVGTLAARSFSGFELEMSRIEGLVGVNRDQVQAWGDDILKLGQAIGKSPQELASAMFFISSSGLQGQKAWDALVASAKASVAGLGQTKVVADAVTSAMNAYAKTGLTATNATDILTAAVREGKAEASSFAPVMGRVLPLASSLGVSFADVAGAMAAMTRTGSSAAEAGTQVTAFLSSLIKPGKEAREMLESAGLNFKDLRDLVARPGGMVEAMRLLNKTLTLEQLGKVEPNLRSLRGIFNLLNQDAKSVDDVLKGVRDSAGDTGKAFAVTSDTLTFKWEQLKASFQATFIVLGKQLAPVFEGMIKIGQSILNTWNSLSNETKVLTATFLGLVAVVGPLLTLFGALAPSLVGGASMMKGIFAPIAGMIGAIVGPLFSLMSPIGAIKAGWLGITSIIGLFGKAIVGLPVLLLSLLNPLKLISGLVMLIKGGIMLYYGPLVTVLKTVVSLVAVFALWHSKSGSIVQMWIDIKQKAMEFWEFIRPIREALVDLFMVVFKQGYDAFVKLGQVTLEWFNSLMGGASISWGEVRDTIVNAIKFAEYAITNFGETVNLIWVDIQYEAVRALNVISDFLTTKIPEALAFFGRNWNFIFVDAANLVKTLFSNLASNVVKIFSNIPALIKGEVKFGDLWTPLFEGFESRIPETLKFSERIPGDMENALRGRRDEMADAMASGFEAFKADKEAKKIWDEMMAEWEAEDKADAQKLWDEMMDEWDAEDKKKSLEDALNTPLKHAKENLDKFDHALSGSGEARARLMAFTDKLPTQAMRLDQAVNPPKGQENLAESKALLDKIEQNTRKTADEVEDLGYENADLEE